MAAEAPQEVSAGSARRAPLGRWRPPPAAALAVAARVRPFAPLLAVLALSFAVNTWSISQAGFGNAYYAAAARSMTLSWSNFFFGAFDPGGFITVDKPPVFLWVGALSARLFGYSTWSVMLPSAVAGAATAGLLWLIVRRYFGQTAAAAAAAAFVLSPISVAVDRLNLPEPFLVLALVGAAGAVLRSLEARRGWAWAGLAGLLVGVAFNVKMLAAWIPGPALALALVAGWDGPWRRALRLTAGRLTVLGVATLLASASWMAVVDRWPESSRPYIGGSTDNTVQDLVLGYNGFGRVDGEAQGRPGNRGAPPGPGPGARGVLPGGPPPGAPPPPPGAGPGGPPGNGPGGIIAGAPSPWRMFDAANGGQIAWLLPFAVLGSAWSAWVWRGHAAKRAAVVLFLGWVLFHAAVFSFAKGIYHSYYTAAMAPGVAALVGINGVSAVEAVRRHRAWLPLIAGALAVTAWVQVDVAGRFPGFFDWLRPYTIAGVILGVGVSTVALFSRRIPRGAGIALSLSALLLLPGGWSLSEASQPPLNTTLPQAGPRQGPSGRTFGSQAFDDGTDAIARWLASRREEGARWDLAVGSAQSGSILIAKHSLSVMALGGFSGRDETVSLREFADHVARGDVRYVSTETGPGRPPPGAPAPPAPGRPPGLPAPLPPPGGPGGGPPGPPGTGRGAPPAGPAFGPPPGGATGTIMAAVRAACVPVRDPSLPRRYDGMLFDCAGRGGALAARG